MPALPPILLFSERLPDFITYALYDIVSFPDSYAIELFVSGLFVEKYYFFAYAAGSGTLNGRPNSCYAAVTRVYRSRSEILRFARYNGKGQEAG